MRTKIRGRVRIERPDDDVLELVVAPQPQPSTLEIPGATLAHTLVRLDGQAVQGEVVGDGIRFNLPRFDEQRRLRIEWSV